MSYQAEANAISRALKYAYPIYTGLYSFLIGDNTTNLLQLRGPIRPTGFNALSRRYELKWVAGQRGKPGINADMASGTEAVREIADPDFEVLGANGVSASTTFYAEGGLVCTTAGAEGDEVIILPHLDANQSAWGLVTWGTDQQTEWECDITTGASITNVIIWAGLKLTNTEVLITDANQVMFRFEDDVSSGAWVCVDSIADTDVSTVTTTTVAINTRYHLKITIDSSRIARFYLNGILVRTSAALTNAIDLIPYIGIQNDGGAGAAKVLRIHGQTISRVVA